MKILDRLIGSLRGCCQLLPDLRQGGDARYTMADLSAFSLFFLQSPSSLAHQHRLEAMAPTYLIEEANGLHFSGDPEALIEGAEPLEAVVHGDGTRRFFGGVAFPAAEAGDGPAGPGEGMSGVGI